MLFIVIGALLLEAALMIHLLNAHKIKKPVKPAVMLVTKGRIAIVIDDWGYNLQNLASLKQIKYPLTLSILPNLSFSKRVAQEAHGLGFEVILHLPMQPKEKLRLEQNTILTSMGQSETAEILGKDLESIIFARGVSNHMGSSATSDTRTMSAIFKELKKRNLYFLDSYVVPESVCRGLADQMNLGFAQRDIFLDNQEDPQYIKAQIAKLKNKARISGRAIGIGHDRKITLQVLKEVIPELARDGYSFVFVSDLVK